METTVKYDNEYINKCDKLVITPLTEKYYITLMTAVKLNLGGSPLGPAGTGKTETTKDLSKALGKSCIVLNCSDQIDYLMMAKLFKGVVSSGSWVCFDEFNRVDIEVLSSVAQQLKEIFEHKSKGSSRMHFHGSDIKVSDNFGVFITMNPGYAGRT